MSDLLFCVTITGREKLQKYMALYSSCRMPVNLVTLGHGTAASETMDMLGLDSTEKAVCLSFTTEELWKKTKRQLEKKLHIDFPGMGIAFVVPVSSVAGKRQLEYLTDGLDYEKGDESELKNTESELIIAVCNQGYSENVMEAAKSAGAMGGTVIHAKGTGMQHAEKFFGITLASEKDMIFIVTSAVNKNGIMSSIAEKAGMNSRAKAIVFSLPVTDTAGLRLADEVTED